MVGVVEGDDAFFSGGAAGEFECAFDGFCAAVAEEDGVEVWGALLGEALDEGFGEEAAEEGGVHLDHVGEVEVEGVADGLLCDGVVAADVEDAEAGEEVEVAVAFLVVEVLALGAGVDFVEADHALDLDEGAVEVAVVEGVVFAEAFFDDVFDGEGWGHGSLG